jgi:aspartate--ammonia ligase
MAGAATGLVAPTAPAEHWETAMTTLDKAADLAGPGISTYPEVAKILPTDYEPLQTPMDRMAALYEAKTYIETNLCKELGLQMVQVPLIVDRDSGVNDYLDRDGSRTPIEFQCGLGLDKPMDAQVVQAATKWKRMALKQFGCKPGEGRLHRHARRPQGLLPRPRPLALRRPVGLGEGDHPEGPQPRLPQGRGEQDLEGAPRRRRDRAAEFPALRDDRYTPTPGRADLPPRRGDPRPLPGPAAQAARDAILQEYPAVFIIGIGWVLEGRLPARDARRRLRRLVHRGRRRTARPSTGSTATSSSGTRSRSAATS